MDPKDEQRNHLAELEKMLDGGKPALTYELDPPIKIHVAENNAMDIDCPCLQFGGITKAGFYGFD